MESIVFFGKGGIGKSTVSSNISVILGRLGHKVLHVGCDPKMDSSVSLAGHGIVPFSSIEYKPGCGSLSGLICHSPFAKGVDCVEAGGPEPGFGCAGVAIGSLLDAMKADNIINPGVYGRIVFDVLGDVVCGGFAAPLKKGFAKKAVIVTSEEILSLYAANNLLKMINNYSRNGVYAAGIALNVRNADEIADAYKFAEIAGLPILGVSYRDSAVYAAAKQMRPAVIVEPSSEFAKSMAKLCLAIEKAEKPEKLPVPMNEEEFSRFSSGFFTSAGPSARICCTHGAIPGESKPERIKEDFLSRIGLRFIGIDSGEVLFEQLDSRFSGIIAVAPASSRSPGMLKISDWLAYIRPMAGAGIQELSQDIYEKLLGLRVFRYDDFVDFAAERLSFSDGFYGMTGKPDKFFHHMPYPAYGLYENGKFIFSLPMSSINPSGLMLYYADEECTFNSHPGGLLGRYSARVFLWKRQPSLPPYGANTLISNLTFKDVITKKNKALKESLRFAASVLPDGCKNMDMCIGCSPCIIFSDFDSAVEQSYSETGIKVNLERTSSVMENILEANQAKEDAFLNKLAPHRGTHTCDVVLSDFGEYGAQLSEMLISKGIKAIAAKDFFSEDHAYGRLNVLFLDNQIKANVFMKLGMPFITPPRPFGLRNTENWIRKIMQSLINTGFYGENVFAMPPPSEEEKKFNGLNLQLKGASAAFIADCDEIPKIFKKPHDYPVSAAFAFLRETNIKLKIFLKTNGKGAEREIIKDFLTGEELENTVFFKNYKEIKKIIAADKSIKFIYSDLRDDSRIYELGKMPFSSVIFEPGYSGAAETLLRFCELMENLL